ncbi:hypothetical protein KIH31_02865 [Paenarthrobacter sp. DKR-5]|uniref:hypothetical protein n=1 Tax=Paenarthrobacter sp. DKR-5 TaxID=2835535 RepID=UPI001BDC3A18|nr:hypothetical protein [Paenarthrobacter sp. DKR-5]MBT1001534.1 hypothetical protein [Paenarthrobacter sp. DKR-5]
MLSSFNPANETLVFLGTLAIAAVLFAFIATAFLGALGILGIARLLVFGVGSLLRSAPRAARKVPGVLHLNRRRGGTTADVLPEFDALPDPGAVRRTA